MEKFKMNILDVNGRAIHINDNVKWHDVAIEDYDEDEREDALNRVFNVYDIKGEMICISDGFTEVEALANELEIVM